MHKLKLLLIGLLFLAMGLSNIALLWWSIQHLGVPTEHIIALGVGVNTLYLIVIVVVALLGTKGESL